MPPPTGSKACITFTDSILKPPRPNDLRLAITFGQWRRSDDPSPLGPEDANAFLRHAFNHFYHDFANVEMKQIPFVWQSAYLRTLLSFREAIRRRDHSFTVLYANRIHTQLSFLKQFQLSQTDIAKVLLLNGAPLDHASQSMRRALYSSLLPVHPLDRKLELNSTPPMMTVIELCRTRKMLTMQPAAEAVPVNMSTSTVPAEQRLVVPEATEPSPPSQQPVECAPSEPARGAGGISLPRLDSATATQTLCSTEQGPGPVSSARTDACEQLPTVPAAVTQEASEQQPVRHAPSEPPRVEGDASRVWGDSVTTRQAPRVAMRGATAGSGASTNFAVQKSATTSAAAGQPSIGGSVANPIILAAVDKDWERTTKLTDAISTVVVVHDTRLALAFCSTDGALTLPINRNAMPFSGLHAAQLGIQIVIGPI